MSRLVEGHEIDDIKLKKPFRLIIAGGSGCGKSQFCKKLVDENFFESSFDRIIYNYPDYLEETDIDFDALVEYRPGLADQTFLSSLAKNTLLIIDDLTLEVSKSVAINNLFAVEARKRNISVILITQNVYQRGEYFRNIRLNATGFALFKFFSAFDVNKRLMRDFGLKTIPEKLMNKIYRGKYKYIFLDLHPNRQSDFGLARSNIFDIPEIYHNMKYIAIKEADFYKYFKILDKKNGEIKAIKNEVKVEKGNKSEKRRKIEVKKDSESETETETESD